MKKLLKSLVLFCAAAPLLVCGVTPGGAATEGQTNAPAKPEAKPLFSDPVVAKGKGFEIKRSEVDAESIHAKTIYAARGIQMPADLDQQVLQQLIMKKVLLGKATDADRAKAKETYETNLQKLKSNSGMTDEEFNQKLAQQLVLLGISREEWEKQNIDQATALQVLQRDLKTNVTDDDVKKFYNDHLSKFEQPQMVRVSQILLSTKDPNDQSPNPSLRKDMTDDQKQAQHKKMEDLLKRARAGEDFEKLASGFSEDPGSKDRGGEYTFARGDMVPAFESAAFALKATNDISDVVTTIYGYHIIKLLAQSPAKTATLDDEVVFLPPPRDYVIIKKYWIGPPEVVRSATKLSDMIRENLEAQDRQKQLPAYTEKVQKDAGVEILDDSLKPAEPMASQPVPADTSTNK